MSDPIQVKDVRVRMYRGILGDCFLLTVGCTDGDRFILIDCGVLQNVTDGDTLLGKLPADVINEVTEPKLKAVKAGPARIVEIAQDVIKTVNGRIDLLVLTHEHYDHWSGFALAKDTFMAAGVSIRKLWLAWTEKPGDKQANDLRESLDKSKQAIALAAALVNQQQGMRGATAERLQTVASLAGFLGPVTPRGLAARKGVLTGADVIQMLKDKAGTAATRYLEPGDVVPAQDVFGLKAYVLGPPRRADRIAKDKPSSGKNKEVYLTSLEGALAVDSAARAQLMMHADKDTKGELLDSESELDAIPFSRPHHRRWDAENGTLTHVGKARELARGKYELLKLYTDTADANADRRIDDAWSGAAESLALKLDSDTNNTSLVLAFELPDGQVLLFPGDAQVGNWLSWGDQTYPAKPGDGAPPPITIDDILRRVTFYKVGHHASHNATLRELGLEKMTDERLTAAIPVVEAVARIQGPGARTPRKGWKMPYDDLYTTLKKKTGERIVRGDGDPQTEQSLFANKPTDADRPVSVSYAPGADPLWVELKFPLS